MPETLKNTVAYEAVQKIGAINTQALRKFTTLQLDFATFGVESTIAPTKLFSNPDNYKDLFAIESELSKLCCDRLFNMSKQTTAILLDAGDELFKAVDGFMSDSQTRLVGEVKTNQVAKPVASKTSKSKSTNRKTSLTKHRKIVPGFSPPPPVSPGISFLQITFLLLLDIKQEINSNHEYNQSQNANIYLIISSGSRG
jgi:hypothetical protein